ncbi:MAG: transglycosylase domain-containing protein, partial [Allorhizobium sp.]
ILNKAEDYSVVFLDRFGNEVGRRGIRSDDSVALDQMPDYLIKATLATEDRRFYEHFGVDVIGTMRALATNASGESSLHGGSSITQQLAKQLFLSSERTIERKIVEAFLSVWLEWHYSKDEILKLYLDRAYMGGGNFGVVAAAEYYFGKRIQDISLAEAAMLSGLYKAPGRWAPHIDLAAARGRA